MWKENLHGASNVGSFLSIAERLNVRLSIGKLIALEAVHTHEPLGKSHIHTTQSKSYPLKESKGEQRRKRKKMVAKGKARWTEVYF